MTWIKVINSAIFKPYHQLVCLRTSTLISISLQEQHTNIIWCLNPLRITKSIDQNLKQHNSDICEALHKHSLLVINTHLVSVSMSCCLQNAHVWNLKALTDQLSLSYSIFSLISKTSLASSFPSMPADEPRLPWQRQHPKLGESLGN